MSKLMKQQNNLPALNERKRGLEEGDDQKDLILPRVKLLQAMSPEIVEGVEGLKAGMLINSLTKAPLPDFFVPIIKTKNWIRFNPRNKKDNGFDSNYEPGALIWASDDPEDPRVKEQAEFGTDGEKPLATTFMNFLSFFPDETMPLVLSFSKTSYKAGKQLLSMCKFSQGDIFSNKYRLSSVAETSDTGTYFVLKVSPAGKVSPEEYSICENLWEQFSVKKSAIQGAEDFTETQHSEDRPY